jgi:site-specific DNA-cytosine methylase
VRIIDLNCRGGGFLLGFKQAGHDVLFACDDSAVARDLAEANLGTQVAPLAIDPARLPHPDVACATSAGLDVGRACLAILQVKPRAIVMEFSGSAKPFGVKGYKCFAQDLRPADFGIPMASKRRYVVGFRNDVRLGFIAFPFPEGGGARRVLGEVLEAAPAGLAIPTSTMESIRRRNGRNAELGTRFKHKVLGPADMCPSLLRYHKDGYDAIVDSGSGPRRLSMTEVRRVMGFPDDWRVPESRKAACVLLAQSTWPSVAKALAHELADWLI